MIFSLKLKLLLIGASSTFFFLCGWLVSSWKNDAELLKAQNELQKIENQFKIAESKNAARLESQLKSIRSKERDLKNEILSLTSRPVYQSNCFDDDGILLVNQAVDGNNSGNSSAELR